MSAPGPPSNAGRRRSSPRTCRPRRARGRSSPPRCRCDVVARSPVPSTVQPPHAQAGILPAGAVTCVVAAQHHRPGGHVPGAGPGGERAVRVRSVSRPVRSDPETLAGRRDEAVDEHVVTVGMQPVHSRPTPSIDQASHRRVRPGRSSLPGCGGERSRHRSPAYTSVGTRRRRSSRADRRTRPDRHRRRPRITVVAGSGADPSRRHRPSARSSWLGQAASSTAPAARAFGSRVPTARRVGHVHAYATRGARPAQDVRASASLVRQPGRPRRRRGGRHRHRPRSTSPILPTCRSRPSVVDDSRSQPAVQTIVAVAARRAASLP